MWRTASLSKVEVEEWMVLPLEFTAEGGGQELYGVRDF